MNGALTKWTLIEQRERNHIENATEFFWLTLDFVIHMIEFAI